MIHRSRSRWSDAGHVGGVAQISAKNRLVASCQRPSPLGARMTSSHDGVHREWSSRRVIFRAPVRRHRIGAGQRYVLTDTAVVALEGSISNQSLQRRSLRDFISKTTATGFFTPAASRWWMITG